MRPSHLECTACGKRWDLRLLSTCDCGGPLFARYDWTDLGPQDLAPRHDLWRYAPLLPLEIEPQSRGEGGTPLHRLRTIGSGGRVARLKVAGLYVKDEGLNPTGTFKARGMAVAVPMARSLGVESIVVPSAGNAGAALAQYAAGYELGATVFLSEDSPPEARRDVLAFGATAFLVDGDITEAARIARDYAAATAAFNVATLREPYRVEGKKTMLFEIWEALGTLPDWILFPTGGGMGIAGIWKGLQELRELGWHEGPGPRIGLVQAEGCAPLVKAWKEGRETAEPWPRPRTAAAGLRVPSTIGDRIVLRAIRETRGVGVTVTEGAMAMAATNLAVLEGVSACLEGAATLAGLRRLHDDGVITPEDRVVLVNTGSAERSPRPGSDHVPIVRTAKEALDALSSTSRVS